jgi:Tol biopolymer transport system component
MAWFLSFHIFINPDVMKPCKLSLLFLFFLFIVCIGCKKTEDYIDQDKFGTIKTSSINGNSYTSIIATRKDASVEISLSYFDPAYFYKERNNTVYPDYYEVYISKGTPDNWLLVKNIDTTYINKSFMINGLSNNELYYVYLKEYYIKSKETKNTKVAVFVPSAYKPTYSFMLKDYYNHDLYSFGLNNQNNNIVYGTKFYEFKPGYAAASVLISDSGNEPHLVDINCWFPVFNSSGTKISYSSDKGQVFDGKLLPEHIVIFDINTKKATKITSGYSVSKYPAWSPDDSFIAFSSSEKSDQELRISVFNTENNSRSIIQSQPALNQDILFYSEEQPAWSSDMKYIYYTHRYFTNDNINPGYYDIYRIPTKGGTAEPVFNSDKLECNPSISPDNSKLAFLSDLNGKLQIWIYNFTDNKFYQPFDNKGYNFLETWSQIKWKDNNTILFTAFSEENGGDYSIFSISVE